jgi:histidinol-phosphate aminotransferase
VLRDYPDASPLEGDIAARLAIDAKRVVVTAGADDALDRACRAYLGAGRKMLLPVPSFEMLHRFAQLAGGTIETVPWTGSFPTDALIAAVGPDTGVVAMVSPNNPTGATASVDDLRRVAEAAPHAVVLLDHAYVEYADEDLTGAATEYGNVVTVRTFSKAWGLAGCRVGYAVAAAPVAVVLRNAGNPFPVATPSLDAAREQWRYGAALVTAHVTRIRDERQRLADHVMARGIFTPASQANFLLVDLGTRARYVYDALAVEGVRVRFFPHRPEIATSLRVSLPGAEPEFKTLLTALDRCLAPVIDNVAPGTELLP